jgi:hypothetical protein
MTSTIVDPTTINRALGRQISATTKPADVEEIKAMKMSVCLVLFCGLWTIDLCAQQTVAQAVGNNIDFVEHLLTTLSTTSGVHQEAFLDHLGMSNHTDRQLTVNVAAQFKTQEAGLRQQANAALSQLNLATLDQVRVQRRQLLVDTATQLIEQLSSDGARRLNERIQGVSSQVPHRVTPRREIIFGGPDR